MEEDHHTPDYEDHYHGDQPEAHVEVQAADVIDATGNYDQNQQQQQPTQYQPQPPPQGDQQQPQFIQQQQQPQQYQPQPSPQGGQQQPQFFQQQQPTQYQPQPPPQGDQQQPQFFQQQQQPQQYQPQPSPQGGQQQPQFFQQQQPPRQPPSYQSPVQFPPQKPPRPIQYLAPQPPRPAPFPPQIPQNQNYANQPPPPQQFPPQSHQFQAQPPSQQYPPQNGAPNQQNHPFGHPPPPAQYPPPAAASSQPPQGYNGIPQPSKQNQAPPPVQVGYNKPQPPQQYYQQQQQQQNYYGTAPAPAQGVPTQGPYGPQGTPMTMNMMNPIGTEAWKTGLFDCMDDPNNALITLFVPCLTFGQIAEVVDNGTTASCGTSALLYGLVGVFLWVPFIMSCAYRTKIRSKYGLVETPAPDWATHLFCEPCSLCQEYRELNMRGLDPSIGWQGNVARAMQQQQPNMMTPPMNQMMR